MTKSVMIKMTNELFEMDVNESCKNLVNQIIRYRLEKIEILREEIEKTLIEIHSDQGEKLRNRRIRKLTKSVEMLSKMLESNIDDITHLENVITTGEPKIKDVIYIH